MSLEIPEIGFSTSSRFFNATSAGIKILSASFQAQTNIPNYNITASVINNKGNTSNSNINWSVIGSGNYLNSASLNIRKDANVTMVSESFVTSTSGTYKNNYAFNQTASLSSSLSKNTSTISCCSIVFSRQSILFISLLGSWIIFGRIMSPSTFMFGCYYFGPLIPDECSLV